MSGKESCSLKDKKRFEQLKAEFNQKQAKQETFSEKKWNVFIDYAKNCNWSILK